MSASALELLRGLVRSLGLSSVSLCLGSVKASDPDAAQTLLTWAARSVRKVWIARSRQEEPIANAAYLLALSLRDHIARPGTATLRDLEETVLRAKLSISPKRIAS